MEGKEAQQEQPFSACESDSSTSSRTLSDGEDATTDVTVVKVHNFQKEEGKSNAEDDEGSDDDEDEKVKRHLLAVTGYY